MSQNVDRPPRRIGHGYGAESTASARQVVPDETTISVSGTLADGNAFTGQLRHLTTSTVNGTLELSGTITGTGLPAGGTTFTAPIRSLTAS